MRQAIITKYLGPTNCRGARVKATSQAGSITVPWDYALNPSDNHRVAALAFAAKYGWEGKWIGVADLGAGYVWVLAP